MTPERTLKAFTSPSTEDDLWKTRNEPDVRAALAAFLPTERAARPAEVAACILRDLQGLQRDLPASPIFRRHEFIGSTLLFVADDASGRGGVYMLDFGITTPLADGAELRHDVPWEEGNHEDGYMTGVTNLSRIWGEVAGSISV